MFVCVCKKGNDMLTIKNIKMTVIMVHVYVCVRVYVPCMRMFGCVQCPEDGGASGQQQG